MSAGAIRAGQAFVELSIRDKITQGLRSAHSKLMAFGAGLRTISTGLSGLAATGPLGMVIAATAGVATAMLAASKTFADAGSKIHDMSLRTGLAADNLSELKYAADQTGSSIEDVERALRFMAKQGLDVKKFDQVLKKVSEIADESERAAAAQKIFGRGGTALLAMAKELPALRQQAQLLGVSMSPAQAARADELGDSFGRLKAALLGITYQIGNALAPVIMRITDIFTMFVAGVGPIVGQLTSFFAGLATSIGTFMAEGLTAILQSLAPVLNLFAPGMAAKLEDALKKALAFQWPQFSPPNIGGAADIANVGGSARGQFGGFRAESLGIGSGAKVTGLLNQNNQLAAQNNQLTQQLIAAVEGLEIQPEFA